MTAANSQDLYALTMNGIPLEVKNEWNRLRRDCMLDAMKVLQTEVVVFDGHVSFDEISGNVILDNNTLEMLEKLKSMPNVLEIYTEAVRKIDEEWKPKWFAKQGFPITGENT